MNINIKKANRDDFVFINKTRNIESTRKWLENNKFISLESTLEWFDKTAPDWYVVYCDDIKVGYIRISDDTEKSICIGCDIHPDHRRKGIAFQAYQILINQLIDKGYVNIWLDVFENNIPAIKLYEKLNFKKVCKRKVNNETYTTMVLSVIEWKK